tara:strand:- start:3079 stop:3366 length:288 start_codon:yes stop_codon:yes gene_type:complete
MSNMSETASYTWNANDYSNIITIGASALASVLLVIFKSRCKTINLCCGLINCIRDPKDDDDDENNENNNNDNNNNANQNLPNLNNGENIIPNNNP